MAFLEDDGEDEAGEAEDRREAEVDLAGADDEGEADREQDDRRQGRQEGRVLERPQEHLRREIHEQDSRMTTKTMMIGRPSTR